MPNSLISIEAKAFMACLVLNNVIMPNTLTSIGVEAFYGCSKLTKVIIPNADSVTTVGEDVFMTSTSLKNIYTYSNNNHNSPLNFMFDEFDNNRKIPLITTPEAPLATSAVAGNGQAKVNFDAPKDNGGSDITDYRINVYSGETFIKTVDTYSAATSAIVTGLTNGTTYKFDVKATNEVGDSKLSNRVETIPVAVATVPDAPIATSAVAGNGQATVNFTAPKNNGGSGITDYKIDVYSGETLIKTVDTHSTATSVIVKELTNGTTYTFDVKATNEVGDSKISNRVETIPVAVATVPDAPVATSAVAGNGQATVNFTAPKNNGGSEITDYKIDVYSGVTLIKTMDTHSTATSVIVKELTNGTTYTFDVKATNEVGDSKISNRVETIPVAVATVPDAPVATNAVAGNGQATVNFTAPKNNGGSKITDYKIDVYSGKTLIKTVDTHSTATSVIVKELTNGTRYTFDVKATNEIGDSKVSNSVETTPVAPTPVTILDPVAAPTPISTPTTISDPVAAPAAISTPTTISTQSMPKTATPYYNYIIIGLMTFMFGLGLWIYDSKRKKVK
ncbi:fibronectin type III domain-containing protein [Clostridium lacusfryxellense]|nr:fibronectin type III domain-containing protein [Clostridium lacusfryxellense]